jgi:hypothetical protein
MIVLVILALAGAASGALDTAPAPASVTQPADWATR